MAILMSLGAVFQNRTPPLTWGGVKPPFLVAVVAYYAMLRPLWLAGLAAVWAGLLLDGLGCAPIATSLAGMLGMLAFCGFWARRQMAESVPTCALITVGAAAGIALLQYGVLRWRGGFPRLDVASLVLRLVLHGVLAVPVGVATAWAAKVLDRLALNTYTENHADGFDWSGSGG